MKYSRIAGTGAYLPKNSVSNADLIKRGIDTTDEWIVSRTGIRARHLADASDTTSTMATAAAKKALEAAGCSAKEIQLIIVATSTPDKYFPSTACLVQSALGVDGCPAFDVVAACAGFNYALSVADQFIRNGQINSALVIGSETMSSIINWEDRSTCILFGDGAGAVVLQASDTPGIISTHLHAAGSYKDLLFLGTGLREEKAHLVMQGNPVFRIAVKKLSEILDETLQANGIQASAIDWLIPHQANLRIITAMADKLKLSMDKVVITVDQHGNTSAASVPLALDTAVREGRIQRGQLLLMESFGAGLAWGSALVRF
ncbi:3-oxoacyl-[acyl-carrier-protein] synthase 3 [Candidatus Rickettsiella viridis]|uniref:Beta-ketoacyl-[acyl-carrier-protein] synthase III n=1 Tax=Candidatus Rickettsiella viridis TaxID=676208 RepID=A0A2Z5UUR7_9COXI|nr:beta-ketoacyl-ACP synthase III [Candidatus Rickettsiella viridis]BBB15238.1 3-oxoacyl-[acyl-carrier-protein] synthase 3 [Candidatus Rickettsiella viridis]